MRNKTLLAVIFTFLLCGTSFSATSTIPISTTAGTTIEGALDGDYAGHIAIDVGDVTGDTYSDYLISAKNYTPSSVEGRVYLINGQQLGFPSTIKLSQVGIQTILPGTVFTGGYRESCGTYLSPAGDFDRDGKKDFLFSCASAKTVYMVYGKEKFSQVNTVLVPVSDIGTKVRGVKFTGVWASSIDYGDIDGDGYSDFVIGSEVDSTISVCYGRAGLSGTIPMDSTNCSIIKVSTLNNAVKATVSDVNRDGRKDIIFASYADRNGGIIFGNPTRFASMTLSPLFFDGINAVRLAGYIAAIQMNPINDVNGDRFNDIFAIGKKHVIIFGRPTWPATIDLANDIDGTSLVSVIGIPQFLTTSISMKLVSQVGDYNRDGIGDFAVGDPDTNRVIIQFGKTVWPNTISLASSAIDGVNNIQYTSTESTFGTSIGFIDNFLGGDTCGIEQGIIIGIPKYGYNRGKAYILNFKK